MEYNAFYFRINKSVPTFLSHLIITISKFENLLTLFNANTGYSLLIKKQGCLRSTIEHFLTVPFPVHTSARAV